MKHVEEHEALLEQLCAQSLEGAASTRAPELERLIAECATCRERWQRLSQVASALERDERERGEVLQAARELPPPAFEARTLAALEEHWRGSEPASPRRTRRWTPWIVALAAGLLAWLGWSVWHASPTPRESFLDVRGTEGFAPRGELVWDGRFSFPGRIPSGGEGTLRVDRWSEAEQRWEKCLEKPHLHGDGLQLDDADRRTLTGRLRWTLRVQLAHDETPFDAVEFKPLP